jgi:hypothetical protein
MVDPAGTFVGRERELRELVSAVDDAIAGRGRLYLLAGERNRQDAPRRRARAARR